MIEFFLTLSPWKLLKSIETCFPKSDNLSVYLLSNHTSFKKKATYSNFNVSRCVDALKNNFGYCWTCFVKESVKIVNCLWRCRIISGNAGTSCLPFMCPSSNTPNSNHLPFFSRTPLTLIWISFVWTGRHLKLGSHCTCKAPFFSGYLNTITTCHGGTHCCYCLAYQKLYHIAEVATWQSYELFDLIYVSYYTLRT